MKKSLLVTIADKNYINLAKQLFSSVYFNAGWKGDYMLLPYQIPEADLEWFRKKGILVFNCDKRCQYMKSPEAKFLKYCLFCEEFRERENIIYLDADIMVKASLDELADAKGFWAAKDSKPLFQQFTAKNDHEMILLHELSLNYDLRSPSFNSGVMVFSSEIINKDIFGKLRKIYEKYSTIFAYTDQPLLNLLFYKQWKALPRIYNVFTNLSNDSSVGKVETNSDTMEGAIFHFLGIGQSHEWETSSEIRYKEFQENLRKAELINISNILSSRYVFTKTEIDELETKYIDLFSGPLGRRERLRLFLIRHFVRLYLILRFLVRSFFYKSRSV